MPFFFHFGGIDFIFVAIGVSMVVRAFRGGGRRWRSLEPPPPAVIEDPRVPQLQSEVDELRSQVERLAAAESFYAQLNAPAPSTPQPLPMPAPTAAQPSTVAPPTASVGPRVG